MTGIRDVSQGSGLDIKPYALLWCSLTPIASKLLETQDIDAHGNVQLSGTGALGDSLAERIKKNLTPIGGRKLRVRADTFGYLQRCWHDASEVDQREAREVGQAAAKLALEGDDDASVALVRLGNDPYTSTTKRISLGDVAAKTRHMPPEFISGTSDVSEAFVEYCRPLVGELPEVGRL